MSNKEEKVNKLEEKRVSESSSSVIHSKNTRRQVIKWSVVCVVFLITGLLSFYFISPYRLIKDITVSGAEEVYDQVILESSGLSSEQSIWENYLNKSDIEENIVQAHPQIKSAELILSGIQDVVIEVEEYETVAYLSNNNTYKKILENGDILDDTVPRISSNQPILNDFEEGRPLELMISEYEEVNQPVQNLISEIDYLDDDRNTMLLRVFMNDGNEVLVPVPVFSERMNYYPQMKAAVNDTKGVFDLEAGAYFVPFESSEEEELGDFEDSEETEEVE